ncbi:hypothetical protein B0H14DRAFT_3445442 [Mycena olivaceomarginata]|nr:hypothetical protein B0H14DRAFT_3445442 [Mycena olivaceomarginata]
MNRVGDVPAPVDTKALEVLFSNDEEAQEAASKARRELLSLLSFLSWMLSLVQLKDTKLSSGDQQYLLQLKLDERPKTGAVFDLTRDQHEINFPHWANNGVPFHYVWTEEEKKNKCFLRFSPEYYEEVVRLREAAGGRDVSVEELPSYATWKGDLEGSDWLGQNLRAGKMGVVENRFLPSMKYGIVDRHLYGSRPLANWVTIRVYAERFKALIRDTERETTSPRTPVNRCQHKFSLSDFAYQEVGESVPEQARYYESNTVAEAEISRDAGNRPSSEELHREGKHRNPDAPHAPLRRLAEAAALTLTSEAAGRVRREGKEQRRQARSLSSVRTAESDGENAWFEEEFQSAAGSDDNGAYSQDEEMGDDTPFEASLDLVGSWSPRFRTAKEAVDALDLWAPTVMEYEPKKAVYNPLSWNSDWLDRAYLVVDDPRTLARLKALCALFPAELDNMQVVLEYAMRFGMPFELFTKIQDAGMYRNHQLSSLALNTLPSVYNLGYVDQVMSWAGAATQPNSECTWGTIFQLLQKPNAVAFISKGGVCKFVAELFAPDLAYRFVRGPSEQVSDDQVSDVEVAILLGYVKGKNSDQERSLWPSQALLEQHSLHVRGYLSSGAWTVLEYLRKRIMEEKIYDWKSKAEWKSYLRGGAKGEYAPSVVPSKADFEEGMADPGRLLPGGLATHTCFEDCPAGTVQSSCAPKLGGLFSTRMTLILYDVSAPIFGTDRGTGDPYTTHTT